MNTNNIYKTYDLVIIGGGSAGMASAVRAYDLGIRSILILEKDNVLGGILNQCIHNGFGLQEFNEELTGGEYIDKYVHLIHERNIEYKLNTYVNYISKDKLVNYTNSIEGVVTIKANAIIVSTGCYERNAGSIKLPGVRCSGILTAGSAQRYINIHGYMVGKKVVILGSGDIGLIMARRLTLEGAKVLRVIEINPYSAGLNRNIQQCLLDYDIPLYLSSTISDVKANNGRLSSVTISKVDDKYNVIKNTGEEIECDTLILSVGLTPYLPEVDMNTTFELGPTKGYKVDQYLQSNNEGIFTCGNALHVHDVVDFVSKEAKEVAGNVYKYLHYELVMNNKIDISIGNNISYTIPSSIYLDSNDDISVKFRVRKPIKDCFIVVKDNKDKTILQLKKVALIPSEMVNITIPRNKIDKDITSLSISIDW